MWTHDTVHPDVGLDEFECCTFVLEAEREIGTHAWTSFLQVSQVFHSAFDLILRNLYAWLSHARTVPIDECLYVSAQIAIEA